MHHLWYKTFGKDHAGFPSIRGWKCSNCGTFEGQTERPLHDMKYRHDLEKKGGAIYVTCGEIVAFQVMET